MFKQQWKEYIDLINVELDKYLAQHKTQNEKLFKAMKYSVFAGGKRLRPILAMAAYNLFDDNTNEIIPYACAFEMIHTYSLIHDDLPAMDNDDFRRGKPTNHKVFGEGIAILAGDGLLNYAFEIMLRDALNKQNPQNSILATYEIAKSAGVNGMIAGQMMDLESENKIIDFQTLDYIHVNKTAELIKAPLKVGAIIAGAKGSDIMNMETVGLKLGLAFQIQDDILDIVGQKDKLGKNVGSDQEKNKSTYPFIYGIEKSVDKVKKLTLEANDILQKYRPRSNFLIELSNYLINRDH